MDESPSGIIDIENSDHSDSSNASNSSVIFVSCIKSDSASPSKPIYSNSSSDEINKNDDPLKLISRKRTRNPDNWVRNIQKRRRTKGLEYKNRRGVIVPAKEFIDTICNCRQKCNERIISDDREAAMKAFYSLDSQLEQNMFLRDCIRVNEIKRRRPTSNTKVPRAHSFTYFFRKGQDSQDDIPVCKKYFKDTYQVSDGRLYDCCCKI